MKREELYYGIIIGFIANQIAVNYDYNPTQLSYWIIVTITVIVLSYLSPTKKKTSSNE